MNEKKAITQNYENVGQSTDKNKTTIISKQSMQNKNLQQSSPAREVAEFMPPFKVLSVRFPIFANKCNIKVTNYK